MDSNERPKLLLDQDIGMYFDYTVKEADKWSKAINTFLKRVGKYNSLVDNDDNTLTFKELKTMIKNKEISIKILNINELESKKQEYIKNMTFLFNYNYPKEYYTKNKIEALLYSIIYNAYLKCIENLSNNILIISRDYENEVQQKTNPLLDSNNLLNIPQISNIYIVFLNFVDKNINNEKIKNKNKMASLLLKCIEDMVEIVTIEESTRVKSIFNPPKDINSYFNNESFSEKYFNLIKKYIELPNLSIDKLKNQLNIITTKYG